MKDYLHIYTRVSSRVQDEDGTSLDDQERVGKKLAKELGLRPKVWKEGSASAGKDDLTHRPVLLDLLQEIEKGRVRQLYAWNTDRLSRNQRTWNTIRWKLYDADVMLHTSKGPIDLRGNPQDELLFGILSEISSYDNKLRAERSRMGKLNRVRQGGWLGGPPPFGYRLHEKRLVENPEESQWVKKIFGWYSKGKTQQWIKVQLDTNGVQPRRKKSSWSVGSINALLKNTHYIGHYVFTDKMTEETIEVPCPAFVDVTVWNECQRKREKTLKRKGQVNRTKRFYLLRDFMVCGHCGTPMGARTVIRKDKNKGNENFYYCARKERKWVKDQPKKDEKWVRGRDCEMTKSLNIPLTDTLVWDNVVDTVSKSHLMKDMFKTHILKDKFAKDEEFKKSLRDENRKERRLKKDLETVEVSIASIETDKLLKRMDESVYRRVRQNLTGELEDLRNEVEQTRLRIQELGNQKRWIDWITAHQKDIENMSNMPKETRKEYLEGILDRITVTLNDDHTHTLVIRFKKPIVGDRHEWNDTKKKSDGYQIHEGSKDLEVSKSLTNRGGAKLKKKSNMRELGDVLTPTLENRTSPWSRFRYISKDPKDLYLNVVVKAHEH